MLVPRVDDVFLDAQEFRLVSSYKQLEFCMLHMKQLEKLSWIESRRSCHLTTAYTSFQNQIEGGLCYCLPVKQINNAQERLLCILPIVPVAVCS